jgi:hypothetical protein
MFRGVFSVTMSGENWTLSERGAGTFDVLYNIPSGNKTTVGGIIDAEWDIASTKIVNHMLEINKRSQLISGYEMQHAWINSTTFEHMLANTQLASVRGTAHRVFENYNQQVVATNGEARAIGFTTMFPALPQFVWHIYDATSVVATQTDPETQTTSNNSLYVPDGKMILTPAPEPGGWHGMYHCAEVVRENDDAEPTIKSGLSSWSIRTNYPAGEELAMLHNLVPLLPTPSAVFYVDVWS